VDADDVGLLFDRHQRWRVESITTATLAVETSGTGFFEITRRAARFLDKSKARGGALLLSVRHTSASLVI